MDNEVSSSCRTEKKEDTLWHEVNQLLAPMGLRLVPTRKNGPCDGSGPLGPFKFDRCSTHLDVYYDCGPWQPKQLVGSVSRAINVLGKSRYFIVNPCIISPRLGKSIIIENPYYGCRSLEEAFIMKDLLGNELSN